MLKMVCQSAPKLKWGYKGALDNLCRILSAYGIMANLPTNIVDFGGFDSSIMLN